LKGGKRQIPSFGETQQEFFQLLENLRQLQLTLLYPMYAKFVAVDELKG